MKKGDIAIAVPAPSGESGDHLSPQTRQNHLRPTSEGEAGRGGSSADHRGPRKAPRVSANVQRRKEPAARNEAARIIQQAWRR